MKRDSIGLNQKGFSILEVVIFLVLAGFLSVLFVSYMGSSLQHSADPINTVRDEATVETIVEKITSDYTKLVNSAAFATVVSTVYATDYGPYVTKTYIDHDVFLASGTITAAGDAGTNEKPNPLLIRVQRKGIIMSSVFTKERISSGDPIAYY